MNNEEGLALNGTSGIPTNTMLLFMVNKVRECYVTQGNGGAKCQSRQLFPEPITLLQLPHETRNDESNRSAVIQYVSRVRTICSTMNIFESLKCYSGMTAK
jgi:hypothetical protein